MKNSRGGKESELNYLRNKLVPTDTALFQLSFFYHKSALCDV